MTERRVVITGMGWVTPLGCDLDGVWKRLLAGDSGIGPIGRFDASTFSTSFASEVKDFDLREHLGDRADDHAEAGISTKYALAAAMAAVKQAGFAGDKAPDPARCGVYLGAGEGTLDYDHFMATHVAGWDAESRSVDGAKWAKREDGGLRATLTLPDARAGTEETS